MRKSTLIDTKKGKSKRIGRPPTGIGPHVGLRLHPDLDAALSGYIGDADDGPSLPEAIRRLLRSHPELKRYLGDGK